METGDETMGKRKPIQDVVAELAHKPNVNLQVQRMAAIGYITVVAAHCPPTTRESH